MQGENTRKRRTPEERKAEIIQAAAILFARQGFERTTTKEIATAAGISEGTIYKYFASKQDVLLAFIGPKAFHNVPIRFQDTASRDDLDVIRDFLHDRFTIWEANRDLMKVILTESMFNPTLADGLNAQIMPVIRAIEEYIIRRVGDGAFRPVQVPVAARTLVSTALAYFLKWNLLAPREDEELSRDALVTELATQFLYGIRSQSDRGVFS